MKKNSLEVSEILLSISRSYRHIRAKIIHAPHKAKISPEEAEAIFHNTEALLRILFKKDIGPNIRKFIESIYQLNQSKTLRAFNGFSLETKKRVFEAIFDRISLLDWNEIVANEALFDFVKDALKTESSNATRNELFSTLLHMTLVSKSPFASERLLQLIADLTKLSSIRNFLKRSGKINQIITEFEDSSSFAMAKATSEILLNLSPILDKDQMNKIVDASLSNDQIHDSWGARQNLKKLLVAHQSDVSQDKSKKLLEALKG